MFGFFKRKDDSSQCLACAREVTLFVQTLDELAKARLLFNAQNFRLRVTPDSPDIAKMLLRPADYSVSECADIYRHMEGMHTQLMAQTQQSIKHVTEMGIKDHRFALELEFQRYALRLWMAALATRICPECIEQVRHTWAALLAVDNATIRQFTEAEETRRQLLARSGFSSNSGISVKDVMADCHLGPHL